MGLWALIQEDLRTHDGDWWEPGFRILALHRFGNWRMGIRFRPLRIVFSALYQFLYRQARIRYGIQLDYTVKVGRRVRIWHHGGMVLVPRAIGDDVHIRQNTTFGVVRRDDPIEKKPIIEDRVDIGCGVCILGPVTVGHDSVIGANAVVISDIPPYSVAVGVPARVVKRNNPDRLASEHA
jgi:serine O-acetyltransferase